MESFSCAGIEGLLVPSNGIVSQNQHTQSSLFTTTIADPPITLQMAPVLKKYKAAAVNAEPGWFNLEESVRRTIHWIDEAGKAGCKFIAFPELCKS